MDSFFFFFPYFDPTCFAKPQLTGIKDANYGVFLIWHFNNFSAGGNWTASALSSYLANMPDMTDMTLYVQLDNTIKENKCWTVFKYFSVLVALGKVKKIKVNFLPVGHTHIDIDQVGNIYRHFRKVCRRHFSTLRARGGK